MMESRWFNTLKGWKSMWPAAIIIIYAAIVVLMEHLGVLSLGDLVNNLSAFIGWLLALIILFIQLKKNRENDLYVKKEGIRRELELNAFREINRATTNFSNIISPISIKYLTWPGQLKLRKDKPELFKFDKYQVILELNNHNIQISGGVAEYVLSIEGNEIAVIEYDHLRKYIQKKIENVRKDVDEFRNSLISIDDTGLLTEDGMNAFRDRCSSIRDMLGDIQAYLFDYRIELMNSIMGDVFRKKVPHRTPKDPKHKILTELANK